jgi:integrase
MRRNGTLVTQREGSSNWYCNFTVKGNRFRDSLGTDDKDTAEILAAEIKRNALLGNVTNKKPEIELTVALARYWMEKGKDLPSADDIRRQSLAIEAGLGKHTLLSAIEPADLVAYAASRREAWRLYPKSGKKIRITRGPGTINGELRFVNRILRRARRLWKVAAAEIDFKEILLSEPADRQHILTAEEEEKLFTALRPDFHAFIRFAIITGLRLGNVLMLEWRQVDWEAGHIEFHTKSKKPGGELHYVPITDTIAGILSAERGRHPVRVFTFVADKNFYNPRSGKRYEKGNRYPYARGWRYFWYKALDAAGLRYGEGDRHNLRFHDLRHTAATRAHKATGNLKTVQRMLGHASIVTTTRYARTDVEDVRAAMEQVELRQKRVALRAGTSGGDPSERLDLTNAEQAVADPVLPPLDTRQIVVRKPAFYECPGCGFFHPEEGGNCTVESRYDTEDLEEEFGDGGWVEIDPPGDRSRTGTG